LNDVHSQVLQNVQERADLAFNALARPQPGVSGARYHRQPKDPRWGLFIL